MTSKKTALSSKDITSDNSEVAAISYSRQIITGEQAPLVLQVDINQFFFINSQKLLIRDTIVAIAFILLFIFLLIYFEGKLVQLQEIKKSNLVLEKCVEERTAELYKSNSQMKSIISAVGEGIIVFSNDLTIELINNEASKIFGVKTTDSLKADDLLESIKEQFNSDKDKTLLRPITGIRYEDTGHRINGETFPVEIRIDENSISNQYQTQTYSCSVRDITFEKKAEDNLNNVINKLKLSNSALDSFTSIVSHDLQAPLRGIVVFSEMLAKELQDKLGQEGAEYLNFILESGRSMQALVKDLLEYAKLGQKKEDFVLTDMEMLFNKAIKNLNSFINSNTTINHDPLPVIIVNAMQIIQLLQNLIGNAIKFSNKEKAVIHVSCKKQKDEYLFSVEDNGIGIDSRQFTKIFNIFERLHSRDSYPGTGVGLSICKKVVENHGGKIWVESKKDVGSIFYFTIKENLIEELV